MAIPVDIYMAGVFFIILAMALIGWSLEKQYVDVKTRIARLSNEMANLATTQKSIKVSMNTSFDTFFEEIGTFNERLSKQERDYQGNADIMKILQGEGS